MSSDACETRYFLLCPMLENRRPKVGVLWLGGNFQWAQLEESGFLFSVKTSLKNGKHIFHYFLTHWQDFPFTLTHVHAHKCIHGYVYNTYMQNKITVLRV